MNHKQRRDIRPDAQAFDRIVIETIPRWKESELSGSEWRISATTKFYRKGQLVHSDVSNNVMNGAYLLAGRHIMACDNGLGYFGGIDDICDQDGCDDKATWKHTKKYDWCRDGHKSEERSTAYRLFCDKHEQRGNCGLDDSDSNYVKKQIPWVES